LFTIEDVNAIDASLQGPPDGQNRRVAFIAMMKSGKELIDLANKDRDSAVVVATMVESAVLCHKRLLELADMVKTAEVRARVALCEREDMTSVIAEAKAEFTH
jgi:hypothetical protein